MDLFGTAVTRNATDVGTAVTGNAVDLRTAVIGNAVDLLRATLSTPHHTAPILACWSPPGAASSAPLFADTSRSSH